MNDYKLCFDDSLEREEGERKRKKRGKQEDRPGEREIENRE